MILVAAVLLHSQQHVCFLLQANWLRVQEANAAACGSPLIFGTAPSRCCLPRSYVWPDVAVVSTGVTVLDAN